MWMAEAKDRASWNHTFAVLAQLYNAFRDAEKGEGIDPLLFFPWERPKQEPAPPPTPEEREMLRRAFPGNKKSQ